MSREIKFRAWYDGKMYGYVEHTTFADGSQGVTLLGFNTEKRSFYPRSDKQLVLMQYTGLKDKNGVEIWEGDIVKDSAPWAWVVRFGQCTDSSGQGDFIGLYLEHPEKEEHNGPFSTVDLKYLEVIGNIYQHPHLLK